MTMWIAVLLACVACFALKFVGYLVPESWVSGGRTSRITTLLPVALLAGLLAVQTLVGSGGSLVIDARVGAIAVAIVLLLLRANEVKGDVEVPAELGYRHLQRQPRAGGRLLEHQRDGLAGEGFVVASALLQVAIRSVQQSDQAVAARVRKVEKMSRHGVLPSTSSMRASPSSSSALVMINGGLRRRPCPPAIVISTPASRSAATMPRASTPSRSTKA